MVRTSSIPEGNIAAAVENPAAVAVVVNDFAAAADSAAAIDLSAVLKISSCW